jgi:hypothetical protein
MVAARFIAGSAGEVGNSSFEDRPVFVAGDVLCDEFAGAFGVAHFAR